MSQSELEFSYSDKKGTKIFASATTTLQMKMTTFVGFLLSRKVFVECSKFKIFFTYSYNVYITV